MKTLVALLMMTASACAQSAVSELRTQLHQVPSGLVIVGGINTRTVAEAVVELADRPVQHTCVEVQINISTDLGAETAKAIRDALQDVVPKIQAACAAVGVP